MDTLSDGTPLDAVRCDYCLDGRLLCPGGPHPFGPCGDPKVCPDCGRTDNPKFTD